MVGYFGTTQLAAAVCLDTLSAVSSFFQKPQSLAQTFQWIAGVFFYRGFDPAFSTLASQAKGANQPRLFCLWLRFQFVVSKNFLDSV